MFSVRAFNLSSGKGILENSDSTNFSNTSIPKAAQPAGDSVRNFEVIRTEIKVLPAITDKKFYVFNPKDEAITCSILTVQGQKLAELLLIDSGINELDMSENKQGMYILIFKNANGTVIGKQKVIKE